MALCLNYTVHVNLEEKHFCSWNCLLCLFQLFIVVSICINVCGRYITYNTCLCLYQGRPHLNESHAHWFMLKGTWAVLCPLHTPLFAVGLEPRTLQSSSLQTELRPHLSIHLVKPSGPCTASMTPQSPTSGGGDVAPEQTSIDVQARATRRDFVVCRFRVWSFWMFFLW